MLLLLAAGGIFLGSIHTSFANGDCNTALEPDGQATPRQQRRLHTFGSVVFSPPLPGYGLQSYKFSRRDLIKRFGRPLRSRSWERLPYDPYDPMEVISIWEYSGMILTTGASKPKPNILWMEKIEIFDANIALQFGLHVGQPLDRWVRLFGPPGFSKEKPCAAYGGQYYFSCGPEKDIACRSGESAGNELTISTEHM